MKTKEKTFKFEDSHLIEMRIYASEVQHKLTVLSEYANALHKMRRYNEAVRRYNEIQAMINKGDAGLIHSAAKLADRFFHVAAYGFICIAVSALQRGSMYQCEYEGTYEMFKTLSAML